MTKNKELELFNSLNLIDDIINMQNASNANFYEHALDLMSSFFKQIIKKDFSISIFLAQNTNYILKAKYSKNSFKNQDYKFDLNLIENFIDGEENNIKITTKKDDLLYKNSIISKLAIRNSVFGFCILSFDSETDENICQIFSKTVNILSYKIKDYELNQVFKLQLKAIQEAYVEKEEAYEIIQKQHKKLQELDKTKSLFLANISHELRTPLNAIIGFSQALDSKIFGELNPKQSEYIKDIQISSLHLLGMINEILDLSKIEAHAMKFNPNNINANQIINEVTNILEPLFKNKKIELIKNLTFDGFINADYQKFQQILYNLISNAIKFTNENGTVKISSRKEDRNYILEIQDNGIGIDKKYHSKIFKKFVHLNNVYVKNQNSTGLGLTITKELVKLHHGKITLESELNKGTTFTIEFKNMIAE